MLTREWPPDTYGGAGVHVEHLVPHLRSLADIDVHCFGDGRSDAHAHQAPESLVHSNSVIQTLGIDLSMVASMDPATDLIHSHTWYANFAGHLGGLLYGLPHVMTAHSLEPLRPWKREQLGGGYDVSSWIESQSLVSASAVIAVSHGMRNDIVSTYPHVDPERVVVVHNGIDLDTYRPNDTRVAASLGIPQEKPFVLFVGRITRQKGLIHLIRAAHHFAEGATLVLCASSPDTPQIITEITSAVADLQASRGRDAVIWIREHVARETLVSLLTEATIFACPSVYEPLGIVNLEAMACETAVVASAVGGIPEVVVDGETGLLVPFDPSDTTNFERSFAHAVNELLANPERTTMMGSRGRARASAQFGWDSIARQTMDVYRFAQENSRTALFE